MTPRLVPPDQLTAAIVFEDVFFNLARVAGPAVALRGRLSGELAQVAGAPSLGNVEARLVASLAGVRFSIVSGGVACVVGTIAIARALPALLRYDSKEARA